MQLLVCSVLFGDRQAEEEVEVVSFLCMLVAFVSLFVFYKVDERIQNHFARAITGPLAKRHLNGVSLAGR